MLKEKWNSLPQNYKHTFIFLIGFLFIDLIFLGVFYSGFSSNFQLVFPSIKQDPYISFSPFLSAFRHPIFSLFSLLFFIPLWLKRKEWKWELINQSKSIRLIVFAAGFLLAWELATYDYNYYTDTPQYIERILLLLFSFLILWRPAFVLPFIILSLFYRSSFNYPIGGFTLYDKRLLFDILILFYTFMVLRTYIKTFSVHFIFIILCLIGADYFMSGIGKFLVSPHGYEWLLKDKLEYLFINVHQSGWMSDVSQKHYLMLVHFLEHFGGPLKVLVLLIELGGLFLIRKKRSSLYLLLLFTAMHLGIFFLGSMIFWKWIVIDLILFYILLKMKGEEINALFNRNHFRLSIIVIVFSFIWFRPFPIAWNDTPVNQFYTYEVTTADGKILQLPRNTMNPYHQLFQYDSFFYLINRNCIKISPFGYTFRGREAKEISDAGPKFFPNLENSLGKNVYDKRKSDMYDHFIQTYFHNRNKQESHLPFTLLSPPHHIYNSETGKLYTGKEHVLNFKAWFNQTYYTRGVVDTLRRELIKEITIP